jgi:hypothetical protein
VDQPVDAKAAPGGIDRELNVHDRKKHVIPRPFAGMAVETEPEVQRVDCGNYRDKSYADAKHQRADGTKDALDLVAIAADRLRLRLAGDASSSHFLLALFVLQDLEDADDLAS